MTPPLHLFDAFGIELEYMIVDADSLDVRPISDHVLRDEQGTIASDVVRGPISWSNELTHHVLELKTTGPARDLAPLAGQFQQQVMEINRLLESANARLLPTAMHPWMDPLREMQLWPHEHNVVYETFNKVFDCRGHGWANLQSMHINLPFAGDEEFGRLHAAIRLILPILPALAASSPLIEGRRTGLLDSRLDVYRQNVKGFASIAGRVIPEPVYDQASYDRDILEPMYRDIAPHDPHGVLQDEFLNSRGTIARFSRGAIEIRVIDVQECPQADLAIAALVTAVLQELVNEKWTSGQEQRSFSIDTLEPVLLATIQDADEAVIRDRVVLRQFGVPETPLRTRELWSHLVEAAGHENADWKWQHGETLYILLNEGCLARRILRALDGSEDRAHVQAVYLDLAECLSTGELFRAS